LDATDNGRKALDWIDLAQTVGGGEQIVFARYAGPGSVEKAAHGVHCSPYGDTFACDYGSFSKRHFGKRRERICLANGEAPLLQQREQPCGMDGREIEKEQRGEVQSGEGGPWPGAIEVDADEGCEAGDQQQQRQYPLQVRDGLLPQHNPCGAEDRKKEGQGELKISINSGTCHGVSSVEG